MIAAVVAIGGPPALAAPVDPTPLPSVTFNASVRAMAYLGDVIYVGGDFTEALVNGQRRPRNRLAALDARSGALLDWTPSANGKVTAIAASRDGVYAVGEFTQIDDQSRDSLARLDRITGAVLPGFSHRIYGQPRAAALGHDRLYVAGSLTSVNGAPRSRTAAFHLSTGELDESWQPAPSGTVFSLSVQPDRVYLGGRFSDVGGAERTQKVAAVSPFTGAVDTTFRSRVTAAVHGITVGPDTVYAAVDGTGGRMVAMDRAGTAKWTITTDGGVQAVAVLDDVVYLGGHFDNVCTSANVGAQGVCVDGSRRRVKLAAVGLDGKLLPWTADGNGVRGVFTLTASPAHGQLSVGGSFTAINAATQRRFALFTLPMGG